MNDHVAEKIINELKKSVYPIYIWGAGSMSVEIEKCLQENNIPVSGKFINQNISQAHIIGVIDEIYTIDELKEKHEKINVVMGHGHYEKRNDLKIYSFINEVYIIPNPYAQYCAPGAEFLSENKKKVQLAKECLADDVSICALESYIEFGLTGKIECLLKPDICIGEMFDFAELCIRDSECFADIGAWEGDTITKFLKKTNASYKEIYAFEPEPMSFEILSKKYGNRNNIFLYQCGLGIENGFFYMHNENTQSSHIISSNEENSNLVRIEVRTLDEVYEDGKIDLIKIFVPFMFLDILKGGERTIRKNRPRFVINVAADDKADIFDTIIWINNLELNYKIALRYDFPMPTRLFLYAY